MAAVRFVFSGIVCFPFVLARWRRLRWPRLAVLAALGGIPFATASIAWLILGCRPGLRSEFALLVAGVGIVLIGLHSFGQFAVAPAHQWMGDVFFLLAATCYASFGLLLKHWQVSPLDATIGIAVISMACYTPVYLLFPPQGHHHRSAVIRPVAGHLSRHPRSLDRRPALRLRHPQHRTAAGHPHAGHGSWHLGRRRRAPAEGIAR